MVHSCPDLQAELLTTIAQAGTQAAAGGTGGGGGAAHGEGKSGAGRVRLREAHAAGEAGPPGEEGGRRVRPRH